MASTTTAKFHWKKKLQFHVTQVKHCAEINNFAYLHAYRAQYTANDIDHLAILQAQDVGLDVLSALTEINISTTESSEDATTELERNVKAINVNEKLPEAAKKAEWASKLKEKNDVAKLLVVNSMDAGLEKAISLIEMMPEGAQDNAAGFFMAGMDVAMQAFEFMVERIGQLYNSIVDFIKKIWTALSNAWNAVANKVKSCVGLIRGVNASAPTDSMDNDDALGTSAAVTSWNATLYYRIAISDGEVMSSTRRIYDKYVDLYFGVTKQYPTILKSAQPDVFPNAKRTRIDWFIDADPSKTKILSELMRNTCRQESEAHDSYGLTYDVTRLEARTEQQ